MPIALQVQEAKRLLNPSYSTAVSLVDQLEGRIIERAFHNYEDSILASLFQMPPTQKVSFLVQSGRFIAQRQDATGLESLYAHLIAHLGTVVGNQNFIIE